MADRTKLIAGALSLAEIEREIRFVEAKSFEFLTSKIKDNKDNLAEFKRLDLGNFPKDLKLTESATPVQEGCTSFPNNPITLVMNGSTNPVSVWAWRIP